MLRLVCPFSLCAFQAAAEPEPETIRYTADIVVTTTDGHVLLIERGWDPHKGAWAL
ncbi:hypothetical protein HET65_24415, partial [Streptomyces sp. McG5]|nr:hypothetical protein [Streptomyces sp. McG5]